VCPVIDRASILQKIGDDRVIQNGFFAYNIDGLDVCATRDGCMRDIRRAQRTLEGETALVHYDVQ
jgi:hypothetical protein